MNTLTEKFTTHYLGEQMNFEDFVKKYGSQKDKTAYFFKGGDDLRGGISKSEKISPSVVKNMLELKKMLDSMMNKSTKSNKNEITTPWMVAKNITKIMKQVYTSSGKSFAPHLQSMNYTMSLFVLYIILSTFKWIPSKSKPKTNTEETKEEKQARVNKEKNRDDKNRLIFTLIKVILVVSVMLT
jgi:predicted nucleic acid-binding Zn ribbon protein